VIRLFLKSFPWEVVDAINGEEALAKVRGSHFDLILMDIQMPVMDGHTATRKIHEYWEETSSPLVPIIALTAYSLEEEIARSLEAGCHAHVTKPVTREDLVQTIRNYAGDITVEVDRDLADAIPIYLKKRTTEVREIKEALRREDYLAVESIGHKLVGAAGSYGFSELGELGRLLEAQARDKKHVSLWQLLS
jgi:CheY-like chemotaxis protein